MEKRNFEVEKRIGEINIRIKVLKVNLLNSDYINCKLAEAIAEYLVNDNGDKSKLVASYNEYQETLKNRQSWRDEINALQQLLETLKGE